MDIENTERRIIPVMIADRGRFMPFARCTKILRLVAGNFAQFTWVRTIFVATGHVALRRRCLPSKHPVLPFVVLQSVA